LRTTSSLGRRLRRPDIIILSTWFIAKARCCTGDYGGAIGLLEEAYQLCDRIGDRAWKSRLLNTLGWCFAELGSARRARVYNERAAALAKEIGDPEILANADVNLAQNHLAMNDVAGALAHLEPLEAKVAAQSDPWMLWRYRLHVLHARARVDVAQGEIDAALVAADEELRGARRHRAPKLEARALLLRGAALIEGDARSGAEAALAEALAIGERIGYQRGLAEAHRLFAELARRSGDKPSFERHAAATLAIAERSAQSVADPEIKCEVLAQGQIPC
jgi:tetratricopeptide (TPR) repeat protein